jgi:hypothetical protein
VSQRTRFKVDMSIAKLLHNASVPWDNSRVVSVKSGSVYGGGKFSCLRPDGARKAAESAPLR